MTLSKFLNKDRKELTKSSELASPSISMDTIMTMCGRSVLAGCDIVSAIRHLVNIGVPIDESQADEDFLRLQRISLAIAGVTSNFSLTGVLIFILNIATELGYTITSLFKSLVNMFKSVPQVSTQLIQTLGGCLTNVYTSFSRSDSDESAEPSIDLSELLNNLKEPEVISSLCTVVGGLAALVAASLVGRTSFKPNRSFLENVAAFGQQISKLKNGIYSLISLVCDFSSLVRDAVLSYFGHTIHRSVVAAIESLRIPYKDGMLTAAEFFEIAARLNTSEGEQEMSVNKDELNKGKLVLSVISRITTKTMQDQMRISASVVTHLRQLSRELEARVRTASVKTQSERSRFTPYCIWLYGQPGVGKSVAMNVLCNTLLASLEKEDALKYEIPRQEQQIFSCTFSQEFHTGYNDHYLVKFDDMCQDKPGSTRNSSTLQFIQWVSCVPVNVNQAALEDKKCPFTSKVLVCTSNEGWPNRKSEIQDNTAFLRRRNLLIECVKSDREDLTLKHPIAFIRRNPLDETVPGVPFNSFLDVVKAVCSEYRAHFASQKLLVSTQDDAQVQTILQAMEEAEPTLLPSSNQHEFEYKIACAYADLNGLGLGRVKFMEDESGSFYAVSYDTESDLCHEFSQDELEDLLEIYDPPEEDWIKYCEAFLMFLAEQSEELEIAQPSMGLFERVKEYYAKPKETLTQFMESCYDAALEFRNWIQRIYRQRKWLIVSALGTAALTIVGLLGRYTYLSYYEYAQFSYDKNLIRVKPKPQMPSVAKPSMDVFSNTLMTKNLVTIYHSLGRMNGLFIKDRWLLACKHFFSMREPGDNNFTIVSKDVAFKQVFDEKRKIDLEGVQDLCIYYCDFGVPQFRDITHLFSGAGDYVPENFQGTLVSQVPSAGTITLPFVVSTTPQPISIGGVMVRYFKGLGFQTKGISGSPLVVSEHTGRSPRILGIQSSVLVRSNACLVEPVTLDMLQAAFEQATPSILQLDDEVFEDAPDIPEEFWDQIKHGVHFAGKAEPLHMATKTCIRPSEVAEVFERDETLKQYAPAVLSKRSEGVLPEVQGKDPLLLSMKGFGVSFGAFDCRVGNSVLSAFIEEDKMTRRSPRIKMRLLSDDEILNGMPGIYKGVELGTSPGLPYVRERKQSGKRDFITFDENQKRVACPRVWEDVKQLERAAMAGEMPDLLAYACLKDELRPLDRIAQCKTRTFIVLPMHLNLLLRKYFGTWIAVQHMRAGEISSCVGIDPNTQWDLLYDRLTAVGEDMEDFDYSDWDRTLHAEWFRIYADRVSASYGDGPGSVGFQVRRTLMDCLVHMKIQIRDFVILTHGGNKSGCAITAEINSDVHDMLMYYVWLRICERENRVRYMSLAQFRENCAMIVYGDDIVKATAPGIVDWFNGSSIRDEVQLLGMNITPASKLETEFKVKRISDVTFLKRAFVRLSDDCGLVRAPLDKSVIERMILWIHKSDDPVMATKANMEGAIRESFYWGELFYEELKRKCFNAWGARFGGAGYPVLLDVPEYDVMQRCFREKRADWAPVLFQASPLSVVVESVDVRF
jgi:hypothetical protein